MKKYFDTARSTASKAIELWKDRDIHIPTLKKAIRDLPQKFKDAEPEQQRNVLVVIVVIVALQVLLFTTAI